VVEKSKGDYVMPIVEFYLKDLQKLLKKKITIKELEEAVLFVKGEVEAVEGDIIKLDIKDTNRPDIWSIEGIARELRSHLGKGGLQKYKMRKSGIKMIVDKKVERVRAKTVGAVVKGLRFDDYFIKQIIQLQEKIHQTYGGNRNFAAIGVYDFDKIKFPIRYTTVKPDGIKFIPLDSEEEMTPKEILKKHPCGRDYGHLIEKYPEYPLMIDSRGNVLSIPPIINSAYTGKITEKTKNVFIEITGHELRRISVALNVLVTALAERGGKIYRIEIKYPNKRIIRPDLKHGRFVLDPNYCRNVLGLDISNSNITKLLKKAGYNAKSGKKIAVEYPAYRDDIMHARDIVEDVAISYGYDKIKPRLLGFTTIGKADDLEVFSNKISEIMIGLGLQEILSYTLTNKKNLFDKMSIGEKKIAEIENPISENWNVFRSWLLPSLLEFLSENKHVDYPHRIFEIGNTVVLDAKKETRTRDIRKLAVAISNNTVNYEELSSCLDALLRNLGLRYELKEAHHSSFIPGRSASIIINKKQVGIIGEIHPAVLNHWKLEKPVVGFEIDVNEMFEILK
jgi:phenylalanyl-tRNA synthetase beta chain